MKFSLNININHTGNHVPEIVRLAGAILLLQNLLCVYISGDCGVALQLIASRLQTTERR
jgi:hypothetical protein